MTDLARGGDLASYALFHGVMNVAIALVIGYVLYRLIKTKNTPTKASDYGRNWMAWMALFATLSGLPKVIYKPSPDTIFGFITPLIFFSLIAFILGFVYGKFKVRKDSSTGVVDNPNTTSNNKTINSGVNCSNCGAEITPKGAKFCKHCGTKVEQVITTSTTVKAEAIKPPTIEKKIVDEVKIDKPDDVATQQETNKKIEKPLVHKDIKPSSKSNQTRNTLILLSIFVIILIVVFSNTKNSTFSSAFKAPTVTNNNSPSWLSHEEAMGKNIYNDVCAGCHKKDGSGEPPFFPALKNSSVVNGPTSKLIDITLHGKGGMPTFGAWSNTQLAQVITYVKNNFDNSEVYVPYSTIHQEVKRIRPNSSSVPVHENKPTNKSVYGKSKISVPVWGNTHYATYTYNGELRDGIPHGMGTLTDTDDYGNDTTIYKGGWKNGKRNGYGIGATTFGDKYKGEWKNGKRHGVGSLTSKMKTSYDYTGEWKYDMPNGLGTKTLNNGYKIKGRFENGKKVD